MRLIIGVGLAIWTLGACLAQAQDTQLSLVPADALLPDQGTGMRKSAQAESFGEITIREISLARLIAAGESKVSNVAQHAKAFDFFFVPVSFGVLGFGGKSCQSLQFGATLRSPGATPTDVFLLDIFPRSSLAPGMVTAGGKLNVTGDLKIATQAPSPVSGSLGVGGSTEVAWEWKPLFQKTGAVFDQTRAIWTFDKVGADFPVGQVEVEMIVAVAKRLSKGPSTVIGLDVELRAEFGGGWFGGGTARQNATILVKLP